MNAFIGVDLGWYGKPSGLASIRLQDTVLHLGKIARLESTDEILDWIDAEAGPNCAVGVDAPLAIRNQHGIRPTERALNRDFRRFHAGCHAANLGRPFAPKVLEFSRRLAELGFRHEPAARPRRKGRFQIEVHPHAAMVELFELDRIVKYKRGLRAHRASELRRLRGLMLRHLPDQIPPLSLQLPSVPTSGNLKPVEDRIDAVLCAYIAAHWWYWGAARNYIYGDAEDGCIVVPRPSHPA